MIVKEPKEVISAKYESQQVLFHELQLTWIPTFRCSKELQVYNLLESVSLTAHGKRFKKCHLIRRKQDISF